jgi:ABC-type lipoprotein export system ATPase subunit
MDGTLTMSKSKRKRLRITQNNIYTLVNITKTVQDGDSAKKILENVSMNIHHGEFCGIMGRSGAGKSTLLHILGGIDSISEGQFFFSGKQVSLRKSHEMALFRRNIGFVFQSFQLISHLNVFDNVAVPLMLIQVSEQDKKKRVERALQDVGFMEYKAKLNHREYRQLLKLGEASKRSTEMLISPFVEQDSNQVYITVNAIPSKIRKRLGSRLWEILMDKAIESDKNRMRQLPKTLSGGEKQRVAIARAIVTNPKVILADEPTGSLDTENESTILDLLHEIHQERKCTIIMVSHNEKVVEACCTRLIRLADGKIISDKLLNPKVVASTDAERSTQAIDESIYGSVLQRQVLTESGALDNTEAGEEDAI